jgi:uracil-DNA glycosylase family 4
VFEEIEKHIQVCERCKDISSISELILFRKPKIFYGSDHPRVMLLGHSPAVRTSEEADVVLKMDKKGRPLNKYIVSKILDPLGIPVEQVYCTNMVKCQTTKPPHDIEKPDFFDLAFSNCVKLFELEVNKVQPKLIISLSEAVLKQLCHKYLCKGLKMKDCFGELLSLEINGYRVYYIPTVHIPKKNSPVEKNYFPVQTEKLERLRDRWDLKFN